MFWDGHFYKSPHSWSQKRAPGMEVLAAADSFSIMESTKHVAPHFLFPVYNFRRIYIRKG